MNGPLSRLSVFVGSVVFAGAVFGQQSTPLVLPPPPPPLPAPTVQTTFTPTFNRDGLPSGGQVSVATPNGSATVIIRGDDQGKVEGGVSVTLPMPGGDPPKK